MKFSAFVGAAAFILLAVSPLVHAQVWRTAGSDSTGASYELDVSSLRHAGPLVTSWYRMTLAQDQPVKGALFKRFHSELVQRVDDCANGAFADATVAMYSGSGALVGSAVLSPAQLQFEAVAPGSMNQIIQRWTCGEIARRDSLVAGVQASPASQTQWRAFGSDAVNGVQWFYAPDSIKMSDKAVTVVVEGVSNTVSIMTNGPAYKYYYAQDSIDCPDRTLEVLSNDAYEERGELVYTYLSSPGAPARPTRVSPGTIADTLITQICASQTVAPAPQSDTKTGSTSIDSGTAWLGPKGYLITAEHVVDGAVAIAIGQNGEKVGTAVVVVSDPANDIAVLKPKFVGAARFPSLPLADEPAALGEHVFTLGYPAPDLLGADVKMTSGDVSALSGLDVVSNRPDDARLLQISVPVQSGNSGGPLIDDQGRVAGVVLSKADSIGDHELAEDVNFAIKVGYVRDLLAGLPDLGGERTASRAASLTGRVADAEPSVFLIVVETPPDSGSN